MKGGGALQFMLKCRHSNLISELQMHADPSHQCLGAGRIMSSGIMQTSVSMGLM